MAVLPSSVSGRDAAQHKADSEEIHSRLNTAIYSVSYPTLQDALDDAKAKKRLLVIEPKAHTLPAPMLMNVCSDLHVSAYGATFTTVSDLPCLLDMRDCKRCTWRGGWFNVPNGCKVANAIYVYRDTIQATRNSFQDVTVEGAYDVGVRIGKQGSGAQCDHMWFTNLECIGRGLPGQVGVYAGDGVYANCLEHVFTNLICGSHETNLRIDATHVYVNGASFALASEQDILITANLFSIDGVRSENSKRFLVGGGPASYGTSWSLRNVLWSGLNLASDGYWLKTGLPGVLNLENITVYDPAVAPKVNVFTPSPMALHVRGLMTNWQFQQATDAFDVPVATKLKIDSFIQLNVNGSVASVS